LNLVHKPIILGLAASDIQDAAFYYNQQKTGLGLRFTKEVKATIKFVCNNPKAAPNRYKDRHTILVDDFPYLIHYTVDSKAQVIRIHAVLHTSRDPKNWKNR